MFLLTHELGDCMEHYNIVALWINVQTLAVIELILSAPIDTTQIAVAVSCFIHSM